MANLARISLIGNVGNDPQLKDLGTNKVCELSIAVNSRIGSGQNQQEVANWYRISFWGRQAETIQQYVRKGSQLFVEGKLTVRDYTKQDGTQAYSLDVSASDFQLLGSKQDGQNGGGQMGYQGAGNQQQGQNQSNGSNGGNGGGNNYQAPQGGMGGYGNEPQPQRNAPKPAAAPPHEGAGNDDDLPF